MVILNSGCNFFAFQKRHKYDLRKLLCIGMKPGGVQKSSGLDLKGKGKSIFFTNLYLASFKSLGPLFLIILRWFHYNNVVRNNGILCLVMYYVQNNVFVSLFFVINLLILNWFFFFFWIFFLILCLPNSKFWLHPCVPCLPLYVTFLLVEWIRQKLRWKGKHEWIR